ncbi:MAG: metal ABC transporter ATP-binding protein [Lachnotalea sp.]
MILNLSKSRNTSNSCNTSNDSSALNKGIISNDMENEKILLYCKGTCIGYENKIVVKNLNLSVVEGDYVCIIGENGSGKSTLIKTVLGLQSIISGVIEMDDEIKNASIGYLPQQTQTQRDFPASVYEVVLSGFLNVCKNRPFYYTSEKKKTLENMELVNIVNLKNKSYRELSGGQQQRVLLARALCAARKLLVLDEPVTGLDPDATMELYENLRVLNKEKNMTIIMVSHDIHNVLNQANKLLHIEQETWFYGTTKEFLDTSYGRKYSGGDQ